MVGTIKRLVREKGFGFVRGEDGQERFFHRSALAPGMDFDSLREGEVVSFDIEDSQKGPRACRIDRA